MYSIMSSAKSDNFVSSFPVQIPFISFSSLMAVSRSAKTMLNKMTRVGILVSDLRGNAFNFSLLSMMLDVSLSSVTFIMLRYVPFVGFPECSVVKNSPANAGDAGDVGLTPGSGRSPGVGNGKLLQYSCLENCMDRGAWQATSVHEVKELNMTEHT